MKDSIEEGEVVISFSACDNESEEKIDIEITKFVDTDNIYLNVNLWFPMNDIETGKEFLQLKHLGLMLSEDSKKTLKDGIKSILAILD